LQPPKSISEGKKVEEDFADRRATYACELATTHIDFGKKTSLRKTLQRS